MRLSIWQITKRVLIPTTLMILFFVSFFPAVVQSSEIILFDDLFDVSFPDETNGWACGRYGMVLNTSDGGKTWIRQDSGTDFTLSSIHFVDPKNGWAVGNRSTIIHTSDGGKTWEKQASPLIVGEGGRYLFRGAYKSETKATPLFFMGVHFENTLKGWIVAERTHILFTEDGGKNWQIQFTDEDYILSSLSFCDEYNGWAVGEYGYIYHTNDGGKSWEHQAGGFDISEETSDIIAGNFLFDVVAIDPQTAWIVGIEGYVSRTTDGGATWQEMKEGLPDLHFFGITSDMEGRIIVAGNSILLVGSDSGENFTVSRAEPPISYIWFHKVTPRSKAGFAAVGRDGSIYLSEKNGTSWTKVFGK